MADIDNLDIQIKANATAASNSLDKLVTQLTRLQSALQQTFDSSGLSELGKNVEQFGASMRALTDSGIKTTDFTRLSNNLKKLTSVNSAQLSQTAMAVREVSTSLYGMTGLSEGAARISELVKAISKLGNKSVLNATYNMPVLGKAMTELMQTLARAPSVSSNLIQMTNALANFTAQGAKVGSTANSINSSLRGMNSSFANNGKSAFSLARAFGHLYANYFVVIRGIKQLTKSIGSSMGYIENLNYFKSAFQQITSTVDTSKWSELGYNSAEEYVNSFEERTKELTSKMTGFNINDDGSLTSTGGVSLGINPSELMNYQAMFGQMSSSMGMTADNATKVSQALTEIGADLASVKNMDFDKVWTDMASGLAGMSRTLDKYGVNIRNVNLQQKLTDLGIQSNITNLNQNEKALLRTIILLDSTKYAWGDMASTISQPANQMRLLKANIQNLSRTIGNLFLPVVKAVLPYVNALVISLQRLFVWVGNLMGIDFSKISENSKGSLKETPLSDLVDDSEAATDNLNNAAKAAKALKSEILGFDEITKLSDNTDKSSSGKTKGGGLSGLDTAILDEAFNNSLGNYQKAWNEAFGTVKNRAEELADSIDKAFKPVRDIIEDFSIGDFFKAGQDTSKLVAGIFNFFADAIDKVDWYGIGKKMGDFIAGIEWYTVLKSAVKLIVKSVEALFKTYLGLLNSAPVETTIVAYLLSKNLVKKLAVSSVGKSVLTFFANLGSKSGTYYVTSMIQIMNDGVGKSFNKLISNLNSKLSFTQKAMIGVFAVPAEFAIVKKAFKDLATGSENVALAIAKITAAATAAGLALSVAFDSTAIGLIVSAVALATGALKGLSEAWSGVDEETQQYVDNLETYRSEFDNTTNQITTSLKSLKDSANLESEFVLIDTLKDKYFQLAQQTDLNLEQREVLKTLAKDLVNRVPELKEAIDTETGAYKGTREEIERVIDKTKEKLQLQVYEEAYVAAIKEEIKAEKNVKDIKEKLTEAQQKATEAQKAWYDASADITKITQWNKLRDTYETLEDEVNNLKTSYNQAQETWKQSSLDIATYSEKLGLTTKSQLQATEESLNGTTQRVQETVADTTKSIANKVASLNDTLPGMGNKIGNNFGEALKNSTGDGLSGIREKVTKIFDNMTSGYNAYSSGSAIGASIAEGISNAIGSSKRLFGSSLSNAMSSSFSGQVSDGMGGLSSSAFHLRLTPQYKTGGFPEDGLFFANHNELVGKFSNGQTAVANNEQITTGIANAVFPAVYNAVTQAMSENRGSTRVVLEGDAGKFFTAMQEQADMYTNSTGLAPFPV